MPGPHKSLFVLVPLLSVLATLGLAELGLALLYPIPFAYEHDFYFEPDPHTGFRIGPFSEGIYKDGVRVRANSRGHLDDEVTRQKSAGTYRILMLGDSFTAGSGVRIEDAFPQRLERQLNRPGRARVEVVNTAVGGWNPFQYAQYFEYYGREFQPDLVMVAFFVGNDTYDESLTLESLEKIVHFRRVRAQSMKNPLIGPMVFLHEHSHLARLLLIGRGARGDWARRNCNDLMPEYVSLQRRVLYNFLRRTPELEARALPNVKQMVRIRDLAALDGAPLFVVLLPDENQTNPVLQAAVFGKNRRDAYDFEMPQSMLREMLSAENIPTLDLLEAFRRDPECLYLNDTHWKPAGHARAADLIAAWLEASGVLPHA